MPGLLVLASLLSACRGKNSADSKGTKPPVPVLVGKVAVKNVPVEVRAIGNVLAASTVAVRSRITGQLTQVHFKEGQEVSAGDLLFTIDPRVPQAALEVSRANLTRDEALGAQAQLAFDRERKLFESALVSRDDYDKADADRKAAQATVAADRAAVTNATLNLEFTSIRSPLTGRVGNLLVHEGNLVNADSDVLVTINQIHPTYVSFAVAEQLLAGIQREMVGRTLKVQATAPDGEGPPSQGELSFIDNAVDTTTGTIQLKATFPNQDNRLWPGQFVQAVLTLKSLDHASVIASQAVQSGQKGDYVYVVKDDQTVEVRPVVVGIIHGDDTVITTGLKPGETVVLDGQLRLIPGAKVSVKAPGSDSTTKTNAAPAAVAP
ncbi:MAG TPA: efflux RND transporter periplasmic adaptor subunit [Candidatus Limnocylindria bacterium]|nr:efflux RND transporter periplasmic adaptor subunit [Candidatus Limnocylindria bacterium]